jgi:hypothetical protein
MRIILVSLYLDNALTQFAWIKKDKCPQKRVNHTNNVIRYFRGRVVTVYDR